MKLLLGIIIAILSAALWVSSVSADSIEACITRSPYDHEIVAIQLPVIGNAIQYATAPYITRMLQAEYPEVGPYYETVLTEGTVLFNEFIWTDTERREAWYISHEADIYLFIFNDPRLPGVVEDGGIDPATGLRVTIQHGICTLKFTTSP